MRILIDECLDWRLCRALTEHHCTSVNQMHWGGLSNGMLLQKAETEFDVFITGDMNLMFQQNLTRFNIAVIVLEAGSTRLVDTAKLMPQVKDNPENHSSRSGYTEWSRIVILFSAFVPLIMS